MTDEAPKTRQRKQDPAIAELQADIARLTAALEKIGTLAGHGNALREFGLTRWNPTAADMSKYG